MTKEASLIYLKTIHTLIWVFFNVVIFYMLYAVLLAELDIWFWIGFILVAIEGLVLLCFRFICPITILARKYSSSNKDNFDIYLPAWLAKNTKLIYTLITFFIIIATIIRLI